MPDDLKVRIEAQELLMATLLGAFFLAAPEVAESMDRALDVAADAARKGLLPVSVEGVHKAKTVLSGIRTKPRPN